MMRHHSHSKHTHAPARREPAQNILHCMAHHMVGMPGLRAGPVNAPAAGGLSGLALYAAFHQSRALHPAGGTAPGAMTSLSPLQLGSGVQTLTPGAPMLACGTGPAGPAPAPSLRMAALGVGPGSLPSYTPAAATFVSLSQAPGVTSLVCAPHQCIYTRALCRCATCTADLLGALRSRR